MQSRNGADATRMAAVGRALRVAAASVAGIARLLRGNAPPSAPLSERALLTGERRSPTSARRPVAALALLIAIAAALLVTAQPTGAQSGVPDAPTGLTLTVGDTQLVAAWDAPADTGGAPITGYDVEYKTDTAMGQAASTANDPATGWTDANVSVDVPARTATITGLTNGTAYDVRVRAVNSAGGSDWSDVATETPALPAAPGTPYIYQVVRIHTGYQVYWQDSAFNTERNPSITSYDVQYKLQSDAQWTDAPSVTGAPPIAAARITGLTVGSTYHVRVRANNAGGSSGWTEPEPGSAVTSSATRPDPPFNLIVTPGPASLTVSWTAPSHTGGQTIVGYWVRHSDDDGLSYTQWDPGGKRLITGTSTTITGLTPGTTHIVIARAVFLTTGGSQSSGGYSVQAEGVPGVATAPGAPGTPTVTLGDSGQVVAEWQAPAEDGGSAITGYRLRHSKDGSTWTAVSGTVTGKRWTTIGGLDNGDEYRVQVQAVNSVGISGWSDPGRGTPAAAPTIRVEEVVTGVSIPWGLAFAPDGTMIFTERGGRIKARLTDGTVRAVDADLSDSLAEWETGLLGMVIDPEFSTNRNFYTCGGHSNDMDEPSIQIIKWAMSADYSSATRVKDPLVGGVGIRIGIQWQHAGCRLRFGPDGHLWIATGDAYSNDIDPQDRTNLNGKMLRVDKDTGEGVPGNPFYDGANENAKRVYTYGHRNPQGLAHRPGTDQMWLVEHGTDRDDEVNLLVAGGNYGWAPIKNGRYDLNALMTDLTRFPDAVVPKWASGKPTLATSGGIFLEGEQWGAWEGRLAVATLRTRSVQLFTFTPEGELVSRYQVPALLQEFGRLRTPMMGPDGALYVTTSNNAPGADNFQANNDMIDRILRVYVYDAQADAGLTGLYLADENGEAVPLSPSFTTGVTGYSAVVTPGITSVTATPTKSVTGAAVTVNGNTPTTAVTLMDGLNTIAVLVTAADGTTTRTYTIDLIRAKTYSLGDATGDEGGSAALPITLSGAAPTGGLDFTVTYSYTGNASEADTGTTVSSVSVTAGATRGTLAVPFADDDFTELDERLAVTITTDAAGWAPGPLSANEATATIDDDDAAVATIAFGDDAASTSEYAVTVEEDVSGGQLLVPVTISHLPSTEAAFYITVVAGSTASPYVDADNPGDFTLTRAEAVALFRPTSGKKDIVIIAIHEDMDVESAETIKLLIEPVDDVADMLYNRHFAGSTATITINDNEIPLAKTYSVDDVSAAEGSSAVLTITLSENAPQGGVAFSVAASHQTGAGKAVSADVGTVPSTATVSSGSSTATVSIPLTDDMIDEEDEIFTVTVTATTAGWTLASAGDNEATITIQDNDDAGFTVSDSTVDVNEGSTGSYTIVLDTRPTASVTVSLTSSDAGAVTVAPTSWTFTTSNWSTAKGFTVTGVEDGDYNDESVTITHGVTTSDGKYSTASVPPKVTVNVDDDEAKPVAVSFEQGSYSVAEGSSVSVKVVLSAAPERSVTIPLIKTAQGGATSADYSGVPASLAFGASDTEKTITFSATADDVDDDGESVDLGFGTLPAGVSAGSTSTSTVSITDDDESPPSVGRPAVSFSGTAYEGVEGDLITVTFRRTGNLDGAFAFDVRSRGERHPDNPDTASYESDYHIGQCPWDDVPAWMDCRHGYGLLTAEFPSGAETLTYDIKTLEDDKTEGEETFTLTIQAYDGAPYTAGDIPAATVTITDNDMAGVTVSAETLAVEEESSGSYAIRLNSRPSSGVQVVAVSSDPSRISTYPGALVFWSHNWNIPQTVKVNAHFDYDGADEEITISHAVGSSVPEYQGVTAAPVTVTVTDIDTPGVTVTHNALSLGVGQKSGYWVWLDTQPVGSNEVTVTAASNSQGVTVSPASHTFTADNWNDNRTRFTVTGVSAGQATISHSVSGTEPTYSGNVIVESVAVTVTAPEQDNPPPAQQQQQAPAKTFSITPSASAAEGQGAALTVTLSEPAPSGGVEFMVTAGFGSAATTEDVGSIASPVTVPEGSSTLAIAVPTVDDAVDETDETFTIAVVATGWEKKEDGQDTATVTIIDDDTAGVSITPSTLNLAEGGGASYTVVLESRPMAEVTITAVSSDPAKAVVLPASFVIRPEDWNLPETFTVNGVADDDADDETVTVSHGTASSDGKYDGIPMGSVAVAVADTTPPPAGELQDGGGTEPTEVKVTPGDGILIVTWEVSSRDGYGDDEIRHALRWSQVSGVWANPPDPRGPGRNDGITVEGGVTSYVIPGLKNGVATGVFVRSFVGSSLSERSSGSSKWVRTKGDHTTPRAGPSQQQAPPKTFSISATASAAEGGNAALTITLSEAAPSGGVEFKVTAGYETAEVEDVNGIASPVVVPRGSDTLQFAVPTSDDAVDEDDETFTVTIAPVTTRWEKAGDGQDTAAVTITDDDTAGVTVIPTTLSLAEDGNASYTLALDSQPTGEVYVTPSSAGTGAVFNPFPLVFMEENWDTPQTITLTGAADDDRDDESMTMSHEVFSPDGKYNGIAVASVTVAVTDTTPAEEQQQKDGDPPVPGQREPYYIQVSPGDGVLTVTWTVASREGFEDDEIKHALRWSQVSGVWANPRDPQAGGPEDGLSVEGGVYTYTITGLQNGVATGVFVRSFTGDDYSERSQHSSKWVRIKGDHTTPKAAG